VLPAGALDGWDQVVELAGLRTAMPMIIILALLAMSGVQTACGASDDLEQTAIKELRGVVRDGRICFRSSERERYRWGAFKSRIFDMLVVAAPAA
jgi:hypothetical protein